MGTNAFAEFVASQQPTPEEIEIDWLAERDEFLRNLDQLYARVIAFLQEYIANRSISYTFTDMSLTEDGLGTYAVRRMDIKIGRKPIHLEPIGTMLIGSKGRVDVVGPAGRAPLTLVRKDVKSAADLVKVNVSIGGQFPQQPSPPPIPASWIWKILTRSPRLGFAELDRESFYQLLIGVAGV